MNGFKHDLIKLLVSDKRFSAITEYCSIEHPDRHQVVVSEYTGSDVRLLKHDEKIHIICPQNMSVVQENAVVQAIENGTIFDDAETVDNSAKYISLTTIPHNAIVNGGKVPPKKINIALSCVIGRMDDNGRCPVDDADMTNGYNCCKDMLLHKANNTEVNDIVDNYIDNKDHMSIEKSLRYDINRIQDEIDSIEDIDADDAVTDDDWDYLDMTEPESDVNDDDSDDSDDKQYQEGFFSRIKDWFNKKRQEGMDRSQSAEKEHTTPQPPSCPEYDITKTVLEKIKRDTAIDCASIEISRISPDSVKSTDSVIGGKPPYAEKIPSRNGKELIFLAQVNCSELPELKGYPNKGLLQFWISNDISDDEECEVIYYENPTNNRIDQLEIDMDIYDNENDNRPITPGSVVKMTFKKMPESMSIGDYRFDNLFVKAYNEIAKNTEGVEEIKAFYEIKKEVWAYIDKHTDLLSGGYGNKIGGYPHFCQWDPRESEKSEELLLLQLDSDDNGFIMWGDFGTANFFIKEQDLINHKFGNCMFHWDCY